MRNVKLPIDFLLPIEKVLFAKRLSKLMEEFDDRKVERISVVEINGKGIINDGHHRSAIFDYFERREIPSEIIENDSDFMACNHGFIASFRVNPSRFMGVKVGRATIQMFREYYTLSLAPSLVAAGINHVRDYRVATAIQAYREGIELIRNGTLRLAAKVR